MRILCPGIEDPHPSPLGARRAASGQQAEGGLHGPRRPVVITARMNRLVRGFIVPTADGRTPKTAQRVDDQAAMRRGGVCPSVAKRLELGPRFGQGVKGVQKIAG